MAKEIERKFLVTDSSYRSMARNSYEIRQAYISRLKEATVRVRVKADKAFLTVKGPNRGAVRDEWEYPVPVDDAVEMMENLTSGHSIHKIRHEVDYCGLTWEIDEFLDRLSGLVVAEVELPDADVPVDLPPFIGREVTSNPAYYNSNLSTAVIPPAE